MKMKKVVEQDKNLMILNLLTLVPEFQRDVQKTREELSIKDSGFGWLSNEMIVWSSKMKIQYYQLKSNNLEDIKENEEYKNNVSLLKEFPSNIFERKLFNLGIKYRLPFNFYAFPYSGVARYILCNEIKASFPNYDLSFKVDEDNFSYASVTIYSPLSKIQSKELLNELKRKFNMVKAFTNHNQIFNNKRSHAKFERDINLFTEQVSREDKPKKTKKIVEGSYLDLLVKSNGVTKSQIKKGKKENPKDIVVKFSEPTSKQIGKKQKVSGATARQSKIRLNLMSEELFGYDLEL